MLDIINEIDKRVATGQEFALATVTATWRSAPRGVGASMIIDPGGKMVGSVSGGCVEGQVVTTALELLRTGRLQQMKFGVSNDEAWSVGLSCGGAISVYVQPFFNQTDYGREVWFSLRKCQKNDVGAVLIYGNDKPGFFSADNRLGKLPDAVFVQAGEQLSLKKSQLITVENAEYFFHVFPPKDHLLIIGAAHISRDLITLAKWQGFKITVIDPRGLFYDSLKDLVGNESLFRGWPADLLKDIKLNDSVFAVLLTHDPKIDDQALELLLPSDVAYIGALGSRKTQQKRVARLLAMGHSQDQIDRIKGPVGLDIGAGTASEIALSIMAEIIKEKNKESID
ncbi:MAG: XdhC family protein [Saprospiraceae bacterium]|nr:XdhC family protein [Saprospiraceae bacterium]